jgi:hypothetical protein
MLINSKVGTDTYLFDRENLPLQPEFEDNVVVMDPSHPTSVEAQKKARAVATLRIERSLANLAKNQESLERIVEDKMYNLDVKVTEIQSMVEKLRDDTEDGDDMSTTDRFQSVPRATRSSAVPVADTIPTLSTPPA